MTAVIDVGSGVNRFVVVIVLSVLVLRVKQIRVGAWLFLLINRVVSLVALLQWVSIGTLALVANRLNNGFMSLLDWFEQIATVLMLLSGEVSVLSGALDDLSDDLLLYVVSNGRVRVVVTTLIVWAASCMSIFDPGRFHPGMFHST